MFENCRTVGLRARTVDCIVSTDHSVLDDEQGDGCNVQEQLLEKDPQLFVLKFTSRIVLD